jgi:hypothetical protein
MPPKLRFKPRQVETEATKAMSGQNPKNLAAAEYRWPAFLDQSSGLTKATNAAASFLWLKINFQ